MSSEGALDLAIPQWHRGGNRRTEGQRADHGGRGRARGGLCRPRIVRRLRMDVPARSRQRQGQAGIAGLDPAVDGFVGGIPDGPPRQRESARLRRLYRGSATPDQLRGSTRPSGKHPRDAAGGRGNDRRSGSRAPGVRVKASTLIAPSTRPGSSRACRTADNGRTS